MIASGVRGVRQAGGLRLMDPSRDLRQIADLIQESFAGEMGDAGMAAVRELRHMAYLAPLVWLMDRTSAEFRDAFTGFVWVEGGQIVGNVTLSRAKPASNRWHLSNVAVKEAYRGRGIGRQLVEAALELARARHGEWVVLQVRHDNEPALRIYRRLGFEALFAHTELYHSGILEEPWHAESASGYRLRLRRPSDWRREYDLAMAATSEMQRWLQGIEISEYQRTPLQRFGEWIEDLLGGGQTVRLCLEHGEELAGTMMLQTRGWGEHNRMSFQVHPRHRGRVERMLVSEGLGWLCMRTGRPIFIEHPTEHGEGIAALKHFQFIERRTLVTMRRPL